MGATPVVFAVNTVSYDADRFFCPIDAGSARIDEGIVKDDPSDLMKFDDLFLRVRPYSADEVDSVFLPCIEVPVALVSPVNNRCLAFCHNLLDEGTLAFLPTR